jgi:hypothetical protein
MTGSALGNRIKWIINTIVSPIDPKLQKSFFFRAFLGHLYDLDIYSRVYLDCTVGKECFNPKQLQKKIVFFLLLSHS